MLHFSQSTLSGDGALESLLCQSADAQRHAIEQRAYQMFLERGGTHGYDLHDWLEAKRLLFGSLCS